ncbi:hypothetical protein BpHYR1_030414 [Brachionus plicatilis]|uniref:Uncharacterized protein n=1 Tax=Brachionus plicatilis TaxID=10195 RepID=A0A3M7SMK5_BRAPC|nr:hypothetical protein BpHYR1_030414 [Brachionus plicatilis]
MSELSLKSKSVSGGWWSVWLWYLMSRSDMRSIMCSLMCKNDEASCSFSVSTQNCSRPVVFWIFEDTWLIWSLTDFILLDFSWSMSGNDLNLVTCSVEIFAFSDRLWMNAFKAIINEINRGRITNQTLEDNQFTDGFSLEKKLKYTLSY